MVSFINMLNTFSLCSSASNRIIHAKDHASIQLSLAEVDPATGCMSGTTKSYALCGAIRRMGESDDCINRLTKKDGILAKYVYIYIFYSVLNWYIF